MTALGDSESRRRDISRRVAASTICGRSAKLSASSSTRSGSAQASSSRSRGSHASAMNFASGDAVVLRRRLHRRRAADCRTASPSTVSSLQHGKAAHTGPTSRASLLFQTDVSTLVLPSHSVREAQSLRTSQILAAKFATNPHALRSYVREDETRALPGGCARSSAPEIGQTSPKVPERSVKAIQPHLRVRRRKREAGSPGALHSNREAQAAGLQGATPDPDPRAGRPSRPRPTMFDDVKEVDDGCGNLCEHGDGREADQEEADVPCRPGAVAA